MALTRRKRVIFATVVVVFSFLVTIVGMFAVDLLLHKRAERSAGLNIWGYRGPLAARKLPGEVRIAVLGGSTAFGYGLPWFEAAPAVLEQKLKTRYGGHPPVSVVNLGFNNEGAYAYRFTLEDFRFLDFDVACFFDGYNDMMGDVGPNTALYRHGSPVFRLTGYYPILSLVFSEKAMQLRSGGNLNAAYAASRGEAEGKTVFTPNLADRTSAAALESAAGITQSLERQLARLAPDHPQPATSGTTGAGCAYPWSGYCESMYGAVKYALSLDKHVVVVLQPRLVERSHHDHAEQQAALADMLQRHFASEPHVQIIDLSGAVDLSDRNYAFDAMHLSTDGTERAVRALVERLAPLTTSAADTTR